MRMLDSLVIVRIKGGYLAHLRFKNPLLDEDICSDTKFGIYEKINKVMYRKDRVNYFGRS